MSIEEIKRRREEVELDEHGEPAGDFYCDTLATAEFISNSAKDIDYLLEQNQRLVEALEQFTRGKFYRSIVSDTWGPMVHIENEPWKIAEEALQAYKLLEKKD